MQYKKSQLNNNQSGLVSIIVTMIIIIVISLIVIGFAQLSRREQRQALDKQLNSQAFYAAESGVNDAIHAIKNGYSNAKTNCGPDAAGPLSDIPGVGSGPQGKQLDASSNIGYTCLLIDQTPPSIELGVVDVDKSPVVPLNSVDPATGNPVSLDTLRISWQDKDAVGGFETADYPKFPPIVGAGSWVGNTGLVRAALTPTDGALTRDTLITDTYTTYLYPNPGAGAPQVKDYASGVANQGDIISGKCNITNASTTLKFCNIDFNLTADARSVGKSHFSLRLKSIYKASSIRITGLHAGSPVDFQGAQAMIDSTGRANDVIRRIQVRVPLSNDSVLPQYLLESSNSICKVIEVRPGGESHTAGGADPACDPGP